MPVRDRSLPHDVTGRQGDGRRHEHGSHCFSIMTGGEEPVPPRMRAQARTTLRQCTSSIVPWIHPQGPASSPTSYQPPAACAKTRSSAPFGTTRETGP